MVLQVLLGEQLLEQVRLPQLLYATLPLVRARQAARLCYLHRLHEFGVTSCGKWILYNILNCHMVILFRLGSLLLSGNSLPIALVASHV